MSHTKTSNTPSQRGSLAVTPNDTNPITNRYQSYSTIVSTTISNKSTFQYPTKEQAIILNSVESLQLKDYVYAVGKEVTPKNIIAASRLSNGRICIYLSSKELVDEYTQKYSIINILGQDVNIRKMISPSIKLIISNVCPSIPHEVIEKSLRDIGIKLASPVNFIRAGLQEEGYIHVISFRRSVFYIPDTNISIPNSLLIQYQGDTYRIFLQLDDMKCYLCKQNGHRSSNCTSNPTVNLNEIINKRPLPSSTESSPKIIEPNTMDIAINQEEQTSQDNASQQLASSNQSPADNFLKPMKTKRIRRETVDQPSLDEMLLPIEKTLSENPEQYDFTYETFRNLMMKYTQQKTR